MKIQNFKSFKGALPWFEFTTGINYIVGNNNAGKTTIFKALEFFVKGGFKLSFYGGLKMYDLGGLGIDRCQSI